MSKIPDNRTESVFEDFKKPYTTTQALVEANRCLYCYDAPVSQPVQQALTFPSSFAGLPMTIPKERPTPSLTPIFSA